MWIAVRTNLSKEIKDFEISSRGLTSSYTQNYLDYFELLFYSNFCRGYKEKKVNAQCIDSILDSGLNVVIQYLINYNKEVMLSVSQSNNPNATRKSKLESREIHIAGTHLLPRIDKDCSS